MASCCDSSIAEEKVLLLQNIYYSAGKKKEKQTGRSRKQVEDKTTWSVSPRWEPHHSYWTGTNEGHISRKFGCNSIFNLNLKPFNFKPRWKEVWDSILSGRRLRKTCWLNVFSQETMRDKIYTPLSVESAIDARWETVTHRTCRA